MRAQFITAEEVQQVLDVSRSKSYQIIRDLITSNFQTVKLLLKKLDWAFTCNGMIAHTFQLFIQA